MSRLHSRRVELWPILERLVRGQPVALASTLLPRKVERVSQPERSECWSLAERCSRIAVEPVAQGWLLGRCKVALQDRHVVEQIRRRRHPRESRRAHRTCKQDFDEFHRAGRLVGTMRPRFARPPKTPSRGKHLVCNRASALEPGGGPYTGKELGPWPAPEGERHGQGQWRA